MKLDILFVTFLFCMMPYMAGAQGTEINSRDLRGKVVHQDDEVVFRQLDEHIGQDSCQDHFQACHHGVNPCPW